MSSPNVGCELRAAAADHAVGDPSVIARVCLVDYVNDGVCAGQGITNDDLTWVG
jgi:hypothetical protein